MIRVKVDGVDVVYLHNMSEEDKIKLSSAMEKTEKGRKYLQGMRETAEIRKAFGGVYSIPYVEYIEFIGE